MAELGKDEKFGKILKRFEEAERGIGGLKRFPYSDFHNLPREKRIELLSEPTILTSDDEDTYVVMTVEQYFALIPPTQDPLKKPLMKIFEDRLFREVV